MSIDPGEHVGLAIAISREFERQHRLARGECLGDAWLGLLKAAERFDPARGVKFATFAGCRIVWFIRDGQRAREKTRKYVDGVYGPRPKPGRVHAGMRGPGGTPLEAAESAEQRGVGLALLEKRAGVGHAGSTGRRPLVLAMLARGLTQAEMARSLGVPESTLNSDVYALRHGKHWVKRSA